jgi:hypothetical protein
MARDTVTATVPSTGFVSTGRAVEPNTAIAAAVALVPNPIAFEAALATLVADGASPTQAHVTAVNSAYTTLKTAQTAYAAAVAALTSGVSADVTLLWNVANVVTKNALRKAVAAIMMQATNNASSLSGD